ncbi:hypothetical protein Tco_0144815 [Tanacetum coccineum]
MGFCNCSMVTFVEMDSSGEDLLESLHIVTVNLCFQFLFIQFSSSVSFSQISSCSAWKWNTLFSLFATSSSSLVLITPYVFNPHLAYPAFLPIRVQIPCILFLASLEEVRRLLFGRVLFISILDVLSKECQMLFISLSLPSFVLDTLVSSDMDSED